MSFWNNIFEVLGITSIITEDKQQEEQNHQKEYIEEVKPLKYSFRPQNLIEYIGQERAKELLDIELETIMRYKPRHFIISGTKGTGKSTLAYIIANHLNFKIHTYIAGTFTLKHLHKFLLENEEGKPHILLIDEIHGCSKEVGEYMLPIIEDFILPEGGIKLRPFIFIGATTDKNILAKKLAPLIDRCVSIDLEHYNYEDIEKILRQYNNKTYKLDVKDEDFKLLSKNVRYTPRIALQYFDNYAVCKNVKKILSSHQIIKNSLTTKDITVLEHLEEINKPVGLEVLAIITQQTKSDYMLLQEPFLIMEKYISRTSRGRIITDKGRNILKEIKGGK